MMARINRCLLAFYGLLCIPVSHALDVYIIGGQGDLARRYLWKGFFDLFRKYENEEMHFYGTGRTDLAQQHSAAELSPFQRTLKESIKCQDDNCRRALTTFLSKAEYLVLNNPKQYNDMCSRMHSAEGEVIIYFSVPPTAYGKIVQMIASQCGSNITQNKYKFVFEKPFGTDLQSAISLSKMLENYVEESQVYRVDHYLGKETVHQLLDFRKSNPAIESMMNLYFVKHIDIVVTETLGCKGRASYYDKSGAIRDMLQSHLTEILCLLTMNVDQGQSKLHLMKNISTVEVKDLLLSQYEGYSDEVALETGNNSTSVPTFASARIVITGSRWEGIPVTLSSGKMLNERNGYGKIEFKGEHVRRKTSVEGCEDSAPQVVFVIRHERLYSPAILVDRKLPVASDYIPHGWMETSNFNNITIFSARGKCFKIFVPTTQRDAYSYLIERLHDSCKESFLQMETLLESWRIWSPAVEKVDQIKHIKSHKRGCDLSEAKTVSTLTKDREEL